MRGKFVVLLALLAMTGALVVDARSPVQRRARTDVVPAVGAGLLACPLASIGGRGGTIDVANYGQQTASIRVNWFPRRGAVGDRVFSLRPGSVRSVRLSGAALQSPAGATVSYVGTDVVASHTIVSGGQAAAGVCASPGPQTLAVAGLRTFGASSTLSLFNPGLAPAQVRITLFADGRRLLTERLFAVKPVIRPRARRDFALGDFAFDNRDVTALVVADRGRVAVEGLISSPRGLSLIGAVEPSPSIVAAAVRRSENPGIPSGAFVTATARETPLEGRMILAASQGAIPGMPPQLRGSGTAEVSGPASSPLAAFALSSETGSPLAAASRWVVITRLGSDAAGVEAIVPARRWGAVIGRPLPGGSASVVVVNAGGESAPVQVRTLGQDGKTVALLLQPGRVRREPLPRGAGPVAVEVRADQPVAVFLESAAIVQGFAFDIALPAVPLGAIPEAPVASDGRAAIPARIRDLDR